jgi:hypothetical protein
MDENSDLSRLYSDLVALREELRKQGVMSAVLEQRLKDVEKDVDQIMAHGDTHYVSLSRYQPVEKVLYGMVGLILISFVGALWALIVRVP